MIIVEYRFAIVRERSRQRAETGNVEYSFVNEILVLLAVSLAVGVLFLRLNLPPILGYLAVGVLVGPWGFAWIDDTEHTRALAEFGVVFLLFTIGLEFSLPQLIRMKRIVLGLGGLQVFLTTALTAAVVLYLGLPPESALVLGGVIAMSSTALVIRQLTDQVELHTRHGRNAVGILLFQDVMVIPFLILVSQPSGAVDGLSLATVLAALIKGLLALALILALGRWALRPLFRAIASFRSTELFTLTVLLVTLGAASITHEMGLSFALGAFLAGMMLSETEFRHEVEAEIRPFRDLLLGLFFITIGMLLNVSLLPEIWLPVLALLLLLISFKLVLITILCRLMGWDSAVALRTGLVLAHGGEFGFAILSLALGAEMLPDDAGQIVLAALLLSMAIAPLLIRYNGRLVWRLLPATATMSQQVIREQVSESSRGLSDHVIICGFGRVGQNIARFLEDENIGFIATDLDPVLVQNAIKAKEPVVYGDAANIEILKAAGVERAAALVISMNDDATALKILRRVRMLDSRIPILVRSRDDTNLKQLQQAGATEVVPETMEASLMLSSLLLMSLKVPMSHIFFKMRQVRKGRYALLHRLLPGEEAAAAIPAGSSVEEHWTIDLEEGMWAVGHTVADLGLDELPVTVTVLQRDENRIPNPPADTLLQAGDTLVLFGTPSALERAEKLLCRAAGQGG